MCAANYHPEIQEKLTERALELLAFPSDGVPKLLLDIGCGSGLSRETLTKNGHLWIGLDISQSILNIASEQHVEGNILLDDMGQGLALRPGVIDGAISISAVQWLCNADKTAKKGKSRLEAFFGSLYTCLARGARAVFQVYPENIAQRELILTSAMHAGFVGGIVVDNPNSGNSREYLVLNCEIPSLATSVPEGNSADEECSSNDDIDHDKENRMVLSTNEHKLMKSHKVMKKEMNTKSNLKKKKNKTARSYSDIIHVNSVLGKSLKLEENSVITLGPAAEPDQIPPLFPLYSNQDLILHQKTYPFNTTEKVLIFPRFYENWEKLVKKMELKYKAVWEQTGLLPFPTVNQQFNASEEEIDEAMRDAEKDQGLLIFEANQPSFNVWWELVFMQCISPQDSSDSSSNEKERCSPQPKKIKMTESDKGKKLLFDRDTQRSSRDLQLVLGFMNTAIDDSDHREEKLMVNLPENTKAVNPSYFSFLTEPTPFSSLPGMDPVAAAHLVVSDIVTAQLSTLTSDQIEHAMESFDILIAACTNPTKAKTLKGIKTNVMFSYTSYATEKNLASALSVQLQSNLAELDAYNKKSEALINAARVDEQRLLALQAKEECILELEKELAATKANRDEMLRSSLAFRGHYDSMRIWHKESEQHKQAATKLCGDWSCHPRMDFSFFP
ncbi:18S rRNA (guanine-N(7))-methyltransferase RID2 [Euphorbia peplus]|nr:18S rRNA (guanine-N(7))-methyltransferase RID2 [Euphorbia peplus]